MKSTQEMRDFYIEKEGFLSVDYRNENKGTITHPPLKTPYVQ